MAWCCRRINMPSMATAYSFCRQISLILATVIHAVVFSTHQSSKEQQPKNKNKQREIQKERPEGLTTKTRSRRLCPPFFSRHCSTGFSFHCCHQNYLERERERERNSVCFFALCEEIESSIVAAITESDLTAKYCSRSSININLHRNWPGF